jgi:PKD repeat protein
VTVSNITYTGAAESSAYFEAANTDLNIPAGIFIGSGMAQDVIGPSTSGGTSGSMGTAGDPDLDNEVGMSTYDAAVIEMDIVSTVENTLDFYYIFGSEEYNEWVGSGFNDVFAFYVSGAGINGTQNIATVPGTSTPASINSINLNSNAQYYVDYVVNGGMDTELDGISTELPASFVALANETYHIKIVIADVSDQVFDSGVFIGVESLCGDSLVVPPAVASVSLDGNTITLVNESRYATSYFWDFGDQTTSAERHPQPHTYTEDGVYNIQLITENYCCSDTLNTEVIVGDVGVEDLRYSKPFQTFPNPVNDVLKIDWIGVKNYSIALYDITGKLIIFETGSNPKSIDFQRLEAGMYFLKINTDTSVYTEKVIKE